MSSIQQYWDDRAKEQAQSRTATTNDIHMRELEIAAIGDSLRALALPDGATVVDVGCGDGHSTLALARAFPGLRVRGLDFSPAMVEAARQAAASSGASVEFALGDATRLGEALGDERVDVITTMRCLINLESEEQQHSALRQIAAALKPGGYYVASENFLDGQVGMNAARASVGLPEIPVRWHNRFFDEAWLRSWAAEDFAEVEISNFSSSYYFATRVIYSKLCQLRGEQPDYNHEIHQFSVHLPPTGNFSPIKRLVLKRRGS